jgi:hypothetical protein
MPDVETFEQVIARFGVLDRESGGLPLGRCWSPSHRVARS